MRGRGGLAELQVAIHNPLFHPIRPTTTDSELHPSNTSSLSSHPLHHLKILKRASFLHATAAASNSHPTSTPHTYSAHISPPPWHRNTYVAPPVPFIQPEITLTTPQDPPTSPPPAYPQQPPQVHHDAGPLYPPHQTPSSTQPYYHQQPPHPSAGTNDYPYQHPQTQAPFAPPQGGYYYQQGGSYPQQGGYYPPQQGMYYQQPQGYYADGRRRGGGGGTVATGLCAGLCASLCCLDLCLFF